MKLLDLHLLAYGPFTDHHLDLSAGSEGLHVIFGPNEAGKSSALRALRALLYGIPERTLDAFRHGKTELRVGGILRDADGAELHCYRRKGRKNTLLDAQGNVVAEDRLTRLLGGVDERLFERLFGIDHEALVSGGQALLDERGREAEALFGTGLGSTAVHSLLKDLDAEAEALFAPRASSRLINAELGRLADIERKQREVSLSARQWDEARKAVNSTNQQLHELDTQLAEAEKRRSTLERIRRTLPNLAKRAQIREQLTDLGEAPNLADDFGSRRTAAASKLSIAAESRSRAAARLEGLHQEAATLNVSEELLAKADAIDELREALGSYRKAAKDRPGLAAKRAALEEQARSLLAGIRPDLSLEDIDTVRPLLARRRRATELGGRREALELAAGKAGETLEETTAKLAAKQTKLGELPPPVSSGGLRQAVDAARRAGDIDSAIGELQAECKHHEDACARDLAALGLWTGGLADLLKAPLPGEKTLRRFADDFSAIEEEQHQLESTVADARVEQQRTEESLRALQLTGTVPSETELQEARAHRDQGWHLLRRQWIDGEDMAAEARSYGDGKPLPEAFEESIANTDELADRLRRESQRVHDHAAGQAKTEACQQRVSVAEAQLTELAGRRQALEQSWWATWTACAISPLPPREMSAWIEKAARLRERAQRGDELSLKLDGLRIARDTHLRHLSSALAAGEERKPKMLEAHPLSMLLDEAESWLNALDKAESRRTALAEDVVELEDAVRRLNRTAQGAQKELAAWEARWVTLMSELGLAEDATPGEVSDYFQALSDALKQVDERNDLRLRIEGIDRDAQAFEADARHLIGSLAPTLLDSPVDEAVLQLHARLGKQRGFKSRLDELNKQARQAKEEVREAETAIFAAEETFGDLCRQAGCASPEQLQAIEERFQERQRLKQQLRDVENELVEGGDGLGIEALESEAGAIDHDAVMAESTTVSERIEQELRPQREALLEQKLNAERDFAAMAGSDEACALAEEAQRTLSGLREQAERYVRVKLAARVLRDEIERFRRQHRDPILTRASDYFQQLTLASLASIETDFDESDRPVLVGVRASGERLRVEAMSTGTRDQLYLALRLATLEHYIESAESLPFIVDDILIQFDDERAQATLSALADHSAKTQVILFTHHSRVAEQAQGLDNAAGRVFVHEL